MAILKLRHFVLYLALFVLFYITQFPTGALLSFVLWTQICILLWGKNYTTQSQIKYLVFSLSLVPSLIMLGAVTSFFQIYSTESHILFMIAYGLISFLLTFYIVLFSIFGFAYSTSEMTILEIYSTAIARIKLDKLLILYVTLIVFLISVLKNFLEIDYRISFGLIVAHLFLRQDQFFKLFKKKTNAHLPANDQSFSS